MPDYECAECGKVFSKKPSLDRHMLIHTGEIAFTCPTCGRLFTQRAQLARHMRTHTGERPYKCNICGKSFIQRCHLVDHMRTHTGEKPFVCTECQRRFARSSYLDDHMRTHTGEMPFSCATSSSRSSYTSRGQLNEHMQTHRAGGSAFSCNTCDMSFSNRTLLLRHMWGEHRSRQSYADSGSVQQNNTSGVPVTIHAHRTVHSSGFITTVSTVTSSLGAAVVTTIQSITSPITTTAVSQPSGTFIVTDSDHEPGQDYDNK